MKQLIEPNANIQEVAGWCLRYVDRSFGVSAAYLTAWSAWEATQFKHQDRNFPNVAVPVWFDWWGDVGNGRQRYGHVAYRTPDGIVHSSPLRGFGSNQFASVDTLCQQFGNGMTYVGWSEDISNVKVVGEEDMAVKVDLSVARILAYGVGGRNGINGRPNALAGECDDDLNRNHVGQDLTVEYVQTWYNSPEGNEWRTNKEDPSALPTINHRAVFFPAMQSLVKQLEESKEDNPEKLRAAYEAASQAFKSKLKEK